MAEIICAICNKLITQNQYEYTNEKGKAVHQHCYDDMILSNTPNPDAPQASE
jgi:hypothetical protein